MPDKERVKWERNAREGYVDQMDKHYWNRVVNLIRKQKKETIVLIAVSTAISILLNIIFLSYRCQ